MRLIAGGELEVDGAGRIWRVRRRKAGKLRAVPRRRAEAAHVDGYLTLPVRYRGRTVRLMAHRVVYAYRHGAIPAGAVIDHRNADKRDNRPENLEAVSPGENRRRSIAVAGNDRWMHSQRGRQAKGRAFHPARKLAPSDRADIKRARAAGASLRELAARYAVSRATIIRASR